MFRGRIAGGVVAVVAALLPSAPAAAGVAWPDGRGPAIFQVATTGAASITAGKNHSCALTSLGAVYCWGDNSSGQLGDGHVPRDSATAVPVTGSGALRGHSGREGDLSGAGREGDLSGAGRERDLSGVAVQVDAGDAHTCAIDVAGIAYCWGANGEGQLGIASTGDAPVPAEVDTLADRHLVQITTGADHTCAIDDEGVAWCWGDNSAGQLGVPGLSPGTTVPVRVSTTSGLTGPVVAIAAGENTTCAATEDGAAYCWGEGDRGQLGDGAAADRNRPVRVSTAGALDGAKVRQIVVGRTQACAADAGGRAYCWGETAAGDTAVPAAVDAAGVRFDRLTAGARHVCGLIRSAVAYCWGSDVNGQLGDGSTSHANRPVRVAPGARGPDGTLRDLDAGARHSCALDGRGLAYCWGADDEGQLGNGGRAANTVPAMVLGLPRPPAAVSGLRVTALDGGLRASWRPSAGLGTGTFVSYLAVTTGFESSCAVTVATGTGCDLRGLANGVPYDLTVLTFTSDGTALSVFGTAAPAGPPAGTPAMLAPGGGDLPATGNHPGLLIATGCLLVGVGLAALLVRTTR